MWYGPALHWGTAWMATCSAGRWRWRRRASERPALLVTAKHLVKVTLSLEPEVHVSACVTPAAYTLKICSQNVLGHREHAVSQRICTIVCRIRPLTFVIYTRTV